MLFYMENCGSTVLMYWDGDVDEFNIQKNLALACLMLEKRYGRYLDATR